MEIEWTHKVEHGCVAVGDIPHAAGLDLYVAGDVRVARGWRRLC